VTSGDVVPAGLAWAGSTRATRQPRRSPAATSATGPENSPTSRSRSWQGSPTEEVGASGAAAAWAKEPPATRSATATSTTRSASAPGCVYSEILDDEQAVTAAAFWQRAEAWFADCGINCGRVITDNGSCYRSGLWHRACATTVNETRPTSPRPTASPSATTASSPREWAYVRPWTSEAKRHTGSDKFVHFGNHHRSHRALAWATPHATLLQVAGDDLPAAHP
jgi:hypothetical protein